MKRHVRTYIIYFMKVFIGQYFKINHKYLGIIRMKFFYEYNSSRKNMKMFFFKNCLMNLELSSFKKTSYFYMRNS
ncbi:MAG: hypothetical protein CBB68_00080 [Rhodospirillaceae bacterium TMED8]|nr:MAG: hypothetical protein CBB68_00080 [Rhodospirillaceae bacterium TMED8]